MPMARPRPSARRRRRRRGSRLSRAVGQCGHHLAWLPARAGAGLGRQPRPDRSPSAVLNLAQGALPAARVWISKLLIDAVVAAVTTGTGTAALPEVVLPGRAAVRHRRAGQCAGHRSATSASSCCRSRLPTASSCWSCATPTQLDLVFFERPQFYDLLQQVQREATFRPVQMVQTAFGLIRQVLTFVSLLALLVNLEWFIAVAALLSPIPAFISSARYGWQGYQMMRWQSPLRRMMSLPDQPDDHRHLQQGGQAVHRRRLLHRALLRALPALLRARIARWSSGATWPARPGRC